MAGFGGSVKLTGETEYKKALKNIQQGLREVGSELKLVTAQYNSNDKSTAQLSAKSAELAKKIDTERKAIADLKQTYATMAAQYEANGKKNAELAQRLEQEKAKLETLGRTLGTTSDEYKEQAQVVENLENELKANTKAQDAAASSLSTMRTQINNAEASVVKAQNSLDGLNEELESTQGDANSASKGIDDVGSSAKGAKSGLNDLGDGADEAGKDLEKVGEHADEAGRKLETLKGIASTALKGLGIALAAAGAGAIALGKAAIESYADYEQLVGGVDTLFKEGSKQVQEYAANAYKTAGMSANDYMETVTSFSASLIQSLDGDTVKAAKAADLAITDMSDNANKMGTDISSIQNAYQGFAKQNYTMLDNLKLGYGGTKEEMQRLLDDAEKLSGVHYDMSSLADVYEAIHVVQTELDITGTTAKEAATTISGSASMMQASWANLMTGLADDNADFEGLIGEFVDSVVTLAGNLIPRIQNVISGLGDLVNGLIQETLPLLLEQIPPLIGDLLPALVESVKSIIEGVAQILPDLVSIVVETIPQIISAITEMLPELVTMGIDIVTSLISGIGEMLPDVVDAITKMIPELVDAITDGLPQIVEAATTLLMGIIEAIPVIITNLVPELGDIITTIMTALTESADQLADAGLKLFDVLSSEVLPTVIDTLIAELPKLIVTITTMLLKSIGKLQTAGAKLFGGLITAIAKVLPYLIKAIPTLVQAIGNTLTRPDVMNDFIDAALEMFNAIGEASGIFLKAFLPEVPKIVIAIGEALISMGSYLAKMSLQLFMHILNSLKEVGVKLLGEAANIVNNITTALITPLQNKFTSMRETLKNTFNGFADWFRGIFADAWSKVQGVFSNFGSFFSGLWGRIRGTFSSLGTSIASAISSSVKSGINGVITMIQNTINSGIRLINGAINLINKLPGVNVGKIDTLTLPRLARGGIVDRPTLAEVGEQGREAIIPLENNTEWIKKVAAEISNAMYTPLQNLTSTIVSNPTNAYNYDNLVASFKDALADMKVVLDDEQVGRFVEKTVADAIYT